MEWIKDVNLYKLVPINWFINVQNVISGHFIFSGMKDLENKNVHFIFMSYVIVHSYRHEGQSLSRKGLSLVTVKIG